MPILVLLPDDLGYNHHYRHCLNDHDLGPYHDRGRRYHNKDHQKHSGRNASEENNQTEGDDHLPIYRTALLGIVLNSLCHDRRDRHLYAYCGDDRRHPPSFAL